MQVEVRDEHTLSVDGRELALDERIEQALAWPEQGAVVVLLGPERSPEHLVVLAADGRELLRSVAPDKLRFYYLASGRTAVYAVCSDAAGGRRDWNVGIDLTEGVLRRGSQSR